MRVKAGSTEKVDILYDAFNPFPDTPLTVLNCYTDASAKLKVDCSSKASVSVSAATDIGASSNTVLVTVQDATGNAERQVSGSIAVSVVDKPDPPLLSPIAGKPANGLVNLSWTPGSANGSPIADYQVMWESGKSKSCGSVNSCQIANLSNGQEYSFTVKARNDVGWSEPSISVKGKPDTIPSAPDSVSVSGSYKRVRVSWDKPSYVGTAPDRYTVVLTGNGGYQSSKATDGALNAIFGLTNAALASNTAFTATVIAHNVVGEGPVGIQSNAASPWADPDPPIVELQQSGLTVTVRVSLGNLHNAGCRSIDLDGANGAQLDCKNLTAQFDLIESQINTRIIVRAILQPEKEGAQAAVGEGTMDALYTIEAPTNVQASGSGPDCTVSWEKNGRADSFIVTPTGKQSQKTTHLNYHINLGAWESCSATVKQMLNGMPGKTATSSQGGYVHKVQARVDAPTLRWDVKNRGIIKIEQQETINSYGQARSASIEITGTHSCKETCSYPWPQSQHAISLFNNQDFDAQPSDNYQFTFRVMSSSGETALNNSTAITNILGQQPISGRANGIDYVYAPLDRLISTNQNQSPPRRASRISAHKPKT